MEITYITNNHLKTAIHEFLEYADRQVDAPEELMIEFLNELKVSNLLISGTIEEDCLNFELMTSEEDDSTILALFTDDDAYIAHFGDDYELDPIACDFDYYIELIKSLEVNGIIINPDCEEFYIDSEVILAYPFNPGVAEDDGREGKKPEELLEIARNAKNESIAEFIKSGDEQFEAIMLELQDACLLDVVTSEESLDEYAKDGIISSDDVDGFELCTTSVEDEEYAILFTSIDAINRTKDDGNYYCQLALLDDFFEYVLTSDMDGIIINPGLDDYLIPRSYILEAYGGLSYSNPDFKRAIDYAFLL